MKAAVVRPVVIGLAGLVLSVAATAPAMADSAVPYNDTHAKGVIGLCDKNGQQVTSGDVRTRPFVWRAVSSVPAPAGYDGPGRTATLYSYQPRKGVDPLYWSGDILTASSQYSNPNHPMAAAIAQDEPLTTNLDSYPPDWDGYYQLRLYLSTAGQPAYLQSYAATDIQVTGLTWRVVRGGTVDCSSGTAVSNAAAVVAKDAKTPAAGASAGATPGATTAAGARATPGASASPGAAATGGSAADAAAANASGSASDGASGVPAWVWVVIAALVAAAAFVGGQAVSRRRSIPTSTDDPSTTERPTP